MDVREKLVELIHKAKLSMWGKNGLSNEKAQNSYIAAYLIAHGVTVQEWVSVYDRLPQQGERVLATDGGFVGEMYINKREQWQRYNVNDSALMMALDVLWWMPLPKPPKGERR